MLINFLFLVFSNKMHFYYLYEFEFIEQRIELIIASLSTIKHMLVHKKVVLILSSDVSNRSL